MKIIKILLITVLSILAIVTIVIYSIQGVDYALHFKTYSKIDKFFSDMKTIRIKDKCYDNSGAINKKGKFSSKPASAEVYDKAILSCTKYKNDLSALTIPQELPADRQILLKKTLESKIISVGFILDGLKKMKICNGDIKCLYANRIQVSPSTLKQMKEGSTAALEAQKRLSFNYYLLLHRQREMNKKHLNIKQH